MYISTLIQWAALLALYLGIILKKTGEKLQSVVSKLNIW